MGEHGSFFETMKARLSSTDFPALKGLGARTTDDPSIAMLDGWATQQRARFLKDNTIGPRLELVRRFAAFTNQYPWQWESAEAEG